MLPPYLTSVFGFIKVILTASIPILSYIIVKTTRAVVKFFFLWAVMFISTIAIMKWDVGLFSLYPGDTAGRFCYTANIGTAVIMAWLANIVYDKTRVMLTIRKFVPVIFCGLFIILNLGIIYKTTRIYAYRQALMSDIIGDSRLLSGSFSNSDTLTILVDKKHTPPETIVDSEKHIQAILFMNFEKTVEVRVIEKPERSNTELSIDNPSKIIAWNAGSGHFVIPALIQKHL
jgi:hypothetical protein